MEEILIILLQFILEILLEVICYWPFDFPSKNRKTPEREELTLKCTLWFVVGVILASLSLIVFKHTFISIPELRIANLLLAPIVSALVSEAIATKRAQTNPHIIPRNHFWQALWFTIGLVVVRFVYTTHT